MGLFSFICGRRRTVANGRTARAIRRLGQPWGEISNGRWEVKWPPLKGYLMRMQAWEFPDRSELMTFADVVIDPDWFERGMAIWLLQENDKLRFGSLRLVETRQGFELANGRVCPYPQYGEIELARVASELASETSLTIQKLLAMEFISRRTGDDEATSTP